MGVSPCFARAAFKCAALPVSMLMALGSVIVRVARGLPRLRLTLVLRGNITNTFIGFGGWRRIRHIDLRILLTGLSAQRMRTARRRTRINDLTQDYAQTRTFCFNKFPDFKLLCF